MRRTVPQHRPANPADLLIDLGDQVRNWQAATERAFARLVADRLAQIHCPQCQRGAISFDDAEGGPTIGLCAHVYETLERIGSRQQRTKAPMSPVYYFRLEQVEYDAQPASL